MEWLIQGEHEIRGVLMVPVCLRAPLFAHFEDGSRADSKFDEVVTLFLVVFLCICFVQELSFSHKIRQPELNDINSSAGQTRVIYLMHQHLCTHSQSIPHKGKV